MTCHRSRASARSTLTGLAGFAALAAGLMFSGAAPALAQEPIQLTYGFEPGDTATFKDVRDVTVVDQPTHTGTGAMQAGTNAYRAFSTSTVPGESTAYRFYARWSAAPSSGAGQLAWAASTAQGGTSFTVRLDSAGRVSLRDAAGVSRGQSAPLPADTWHLIELMVTQTGPGSGRSSLRINGTDATVDVSGNFGQAAADVLRVGQIGSVAVPGLTQDDLAVSAPGGSWLGPVDPSDPPPPPPPPPTGEAQISSGFESGESVPFHDVRTVAVLTDPVNSGARALQAGPNAYRGFPIETALDEPTAYRIYARWNTPPASGAAQLAWVYSEAGGVSAFTVRLDAQGRVSLRDATGAIRGQSAPLTAGTWHLIEFMVTQTGTGTGTGSLRINGSEVGAPIPGSFGAAAADRFRVGQIGSVALPGVTHDDVAVSTAGGSWLGPVVSTPPPPPPPPPATQLRFGFESSDAATFQDANPIVTVSDPVNSGSAAMKPGQNAYRSFHTATTVGESTAYRMYARWSAPPTSGTARLAWIWSDANRTGSFTIRVDAQNRVSLRDVNGTSRAQTPPLPTGTWHLLEFQVTQTPAGTGTGSLRVNGTDVATNVPGNYGVAAADRFRVGLIGETAVPGLLEDDVAVSAPGGSWIGPVGG